MATCTTNTETFTTPAVFNVKSVAALVLSIFATRKQRRALRHLDDHQLLDLGLSRKDANAEASKPIWNVPSNWRR